MARRCRPSDIDLKLNLIEQILFFFYKHYKFAAKTWPKKKLISFFDNTFYGCM